MPKAFMTCHALSAIKYNALPMPDDVSFTHDAKLFSLCSNLLLSFMALWTAASAISCSFVFAVSNHPDAFFFAPKKT